MAIPRELIPHFAWLNELLRREIDRLRARYQLSLDEFRGLYVSDAQIDQWIETQRREERQEDRPTYDSELPPPITSSPWRTLAREFGLATVDEHLLLLGSAAEFDLKYETVFAYLNNDVTRKWPTFDMAQRLFTEFHGPVAVLDALSPHSPLFREQLLERIAPPTGHPALLNSGFSMSLPVAQHVHGVLISDPRLSDIVHIKMPRLRWKDLPFSPARQRELARLMRLYGDGQGSSSVLVFTGMPGSGRADAAEALASALALPMCVFDVSQARVDEDKVPATLARLSLQLRLRPAVTPHHWLRPATCRRACRAHDRSHRSFWRTRASTHADCP